MTRNEPHRQLAGLLGQTASANSTARPDFDGCAELVELVRSSAGDGSLRREAWEASPAGLSVCLGSDYGVVLGLDFPAGEHAGPRGAWIRCEREGGAVHWRLGRRQARWLWQLLTQPGGGGSAVAC